MYNYIVLSTPMGFLCNFLHKKINSDKFAFIRILSIIITVRGTSNNEQGTVSTTDKDNCICGDFSESNRLAPSVFMHIIHRVIHRLSTT